ncbi:SRPBCC family protein [Foetidibacter luteolus]|uniref:SRPBCC family protein n=1 Tax=Foetidibacter luteolus TaxID=2608880 RepID=UPI00129A4FE5|nr:SRPBCC family protein [Foetidibacter luteolus]
MRFVKLGLISVVVFFVLLTAMGSLFPSDIIVTRAINISASADTLKNYIADYNKWNDWMAGAKTSDLKVVAKDSSTAFFGTTVIKLLEHKTNSWKHEWKGRSSPQVSTIELITAGPVTTVAWKFEEHVKWYPWAKLGSMMNDKILGSSMEQSLDNLKKTAEH